MNSEYIIESQTYGRCILRGFSGYFEFVAFKAVSNALFRAHIVPQVFEYYEFCRGNRNERLNLLGYPENSKIFGPQSDNIGLIEYCGEPIATAIRRLASEPEKVKTVLTNLTGALGIMHRTGLIANDTHEDQFVVDQTLRVVRVDIGNPYICYDPTVDVAQTLKDYKPYFDFNENILPKGEFLRSVRVEQEFVIGFSKSCIHQLQIDRAFLYDLKAAYEDKSKLDLLVDMK